MRGPRLQAMRLRGVASRNLIVRGDASWRPALSAAVASAQLGWPLAASGDQRARTCSAVRGPGY